MRFTFPAGIFLGSFLLFLVQPMAAKALLPWFGGSAAVWTTCLVFFQVLLLAGYLYAHLVVMRVPVRRQPLVHAGVVLLALAVLALAALGFGSPAVPGPALAPHDPGQPALDILALLAFVIGLPFLVLSANSPLLQAWYAGCFPGRSPYRLYALSNAGSLLGLLCYPFAIEPGIELGAQGWLWTALFAVGLTSCLALAGLRVLREVGAPAAGKAPAGPQDRPGLAARLTWLGLAAASTGLLLAVTNQLGLDVAAVPFLWILPLAVYLVSFILCFEVERVYLRPLFLGAWAVLAWLASPGVFHELGLGPLGEVGLYLGLLGAGCMLCHGELARLKPSPRALTSFYAYISVGGALGGALVGVAAPLALDGPWEYHLSLGLVSLVAFAVLAANRHRGSRHAVLGWAAWSLAALWLLGLWTSLALDRQTTLAGSEFLDRSFFSVLRVDRDDAGDARRERLVMVHGETVHGYQFAAPSLRRLATAYYGEASGIGRLLQGHPARRAGRPLRVGLIGLGVGTVASYARPGDLFRFYEIDPLVVRLAQGAGGFFSFLGESAGQIEVRLGDGRLLLEQELARGERAEYDVLVVDAFSSDAIPVHLLTAEAFAVYGQHLRRPDGVLALHLSNKALDLRPLAWVQGREQGLERRLVLDPGDGLVRQPSTWMLLTYDPGVFEQLVPDVPEWLPERLPRAWTDRFSNLLEVLR